MHACNLHCSSTCGGTSKQTNSHLTSAVVGLNPTESPPMLRPKANLFQVGREKSKDFLSLLFEKKAGIFDPCFFGGNPRFLAKKAGILFFCPFKNRAILVFFAVFLAFFSPLSTLFLANPRGKEDQGSFNGTYQILSQTAMVVIFLLFYFAHCFLCGMAKKLPPPSHSYAFVCS